MMNCLDGNDDDEKEKEDENERSRREVNVCVWVDRVMGLFSHLNFPHT